jgi:hypothetical protein
MTKAAEVSLLDSFEGKGVTGLFIGAPGTGKSELLGSIGEVVAADEVVLICPKPNEANSAGYQRHGFKAEVFRDHRWRPEAQMFEADGYSRLMKRLYELYDDAQTRVVIFDPLTDAVTLLAHHILKAHQVASVGDLPSKDLPRPKHVFVTVHAQPAKEDDIKGNATAEKEAKGVTYYGDVMPSLEGSYRQEIAADFDIVGYTSINHTTSVVSGKMQKETKFLVQLAPDKDRHAKVRLVHGIDKEMPNNLPAILRAIIEKRKA